ncbi:MAG: hypothetical protein ACJAZN_003964, partial [Planctomycetota bacterium]
EAAGTSSLKVSPAHVAGLFDLQLAVLLHGSLRCSWAR